MNDEGKNPRGATGKSDPSLLDAFRKQCKTFGPGMALLAWQGQEGVEHDDLIDIVKKFDAKPDSS